MTDVLGTTLWDSIHCFFLSLILRSWVHSCCSLLPEAFKISISHRDHFSSSPPFLICRKHCYSHIRPSPTKSWCRNMSLPYQLHRNLKPCLVPTRAKVLLSSYLFLLKVPITFVQLELSPPHTPHLSYCSFEPMMPSQPVLTHLPRTHTELLYGRHSVPSVTCVWQKEQQ